MKAIIFDFFGVISSPVAPRWFEKNLSASDAARVTKECIDRVDKGEISEDELFAQISKISAKPAEDIREEWMKLASINVGLVDYIKTLHGRYKIALCSNTTSPFLRCVLGENDLAPIFDEIVISSEVRVAKPDPAIFRIALDRLGVRPEEAVFIDDSAQNVASADGLGIKGIIFLNLAQLQKDLGSLEEDD